MGLALSGSLGCMISRALLRTPLVVCGWADPAGWKRLYSTWLYRNRNVAFFAWLEAACLLILRMDTLGNCGEGRLTGKPTVIFTDKCYVANLTVFYAVNPIKSSKISCSLQN
jgi:hypothetical protein